MMLSLRVGWSGPLCKTYKKGDYVKKLLELKLKNPTWILEFVLAPRDLRVKV